MRIKITEGGPYIVTGGIPLREMIITPVGHHYELREGRSLPQADTYALCRCGASRNAPFCDGAHVKIAFSGAEAASRKPYKERTAQNRADSQCFARYQNSADFHNYLCGSP